MTSFSQVMIELSKILVAAVLGFLAKVLYDRRFAKRPDLIYEVQPPATFGAGEKKRIYQNIIVANIGTERIEDVRIAFRRDDFESVEHQVVFDGRHKIDVEDDRTVVVIPNLPPNDGAAISFVLSQTGGQIPDIENFFLYAKGSNCLGRPRAIRQGSVAEYPGQPIVWTLMGILLLILVGIVFINRLFSVPSDLRVTDREPFFSSKIVSMALQTVDTAARGQEVSVDIFVENHASDPFFGSVEVDAPWRGGGILDERVNIGGGRRYSAQRKLKIAKDVAPGRYHLKGRVTGFAFDQFGGSRTVASIEVK